MKRFYALLLGFVLAGCSVPMGAPSPSGRVVFHTPYGHSRSVIGNGYYQSNVIPQNLEGHISTFRATLSGGPGGPYTKSLPWANAGEIAFDAIAPGTWTLSISGLDGSGKEIARGTSAGLAVSNGGLTTAPGLVVVSPIREAGATGNFDLKIRGIPAVVNNVELGYWKMAVGTDGTLSAIDASQPNPDILTTVLSAPSGGYRTLSIHTNGSEWGGPYPGDDTGTYVLELRFRNGSLGGLEGTFAPVFTIDLYKNLTSTLDVTIPSSPATNPPVIEDLSVTSDTGGYANLYWRLPASLNYISHLQVATTAVSTSTPPTSGFTSVANLNGVIGVQTNLRPIDQPGGQIRFWVRAVESGLQPTAWTSVDYSAGSFVYYVSPTGSDGDSGLDPGSAVATIQRAVDLAQARPLKTYENIIKVMGGAYTLPEDLGVATDGTVPISILGSWDADFTTQDPIGTPTVLTQIDNRNWAACIGIILANPYSAPLLTPMTIDALTLLQTTTDGGGYHSVSAIGVSAVVDVTLSRLTIRQTINDATNQPHVYGINYSSGLNEYGTYTGSTRLRIDRCQIFQSNGSSWQTFSQGDYQGLRGDEDGNPLTYLSVTNSLYVAQATSLLARAVTAIYVSSEATFRNNTFVGNSDNAVAVKDYQGGSYVFENNLFVNDTHATVPVLLSPDNTPTLLRHNAFANYDTGALLSINGATVTTASGLNGYSGPAPVSASSAGNFSTTFVTSDFDDYAGGNLHPSASSDASVRTQGIDGSAETPAWGFVVDVLGNPRTNPWTIGAFQY